MNKMTGLQRKRNSEAEKQTMMNRFDREVLIQKSLVDNINEFISFGGHPLEMGTLEFMESRFGHDFSEVRVHTNSRAAETATTLGSKAFTIRKNIIFANGKYNPKINEGKRLLAHELTHVIQQKVGTSDQETFDVANEMASTEIEATSIANQILNGGAVNVTQSLAPPSVSLDQDEYAEDAYGLLNSCMEPTNRLQRLAEASYPTSQGLPAPYVDLFSGSETDPDGIARTNNWTISLNRNREFNDQEDIANLANTIGHESYHLYQDYEMGRYEAGLYLSGLGNNTRALADLPTDVQRQALSTPLLQCGEAEEWYGSTYGEGANYRNAVMRNQDEEQLMSRDRQFEYCNLPAERDAWIYGRQVSDEYRQLAGIAPPPSAFDEANCLPPDNASLMCSPDELMSQSY